MLFVAAALGVVLAVLFLLALPGFALIHDNQVGIVTKKMFGKKMPEGQIIARNGEIGIQAQTLMPGLYWRIPIVWKIQKAPVTDIGPDEVGVVESVDGRPITTGRLLGDEIECNSYQNAKAFLDSGGAKGPQVAILRPGTYRINPRAFAVTQRPVTRVPKEQIGIVVALDGTPLPSGYIVAPKPAEADDAAHPTVRTHKFFQDGQAFLDSGGYRGPQLDTLQPGEYYVNPLLFRVELYPVAEVPPGYVAVLRSNVGKELEEAPELPTEVSPSPDFQQPVHEPIERILIADRNTRGIWREPVAPGKYNLNFIAFTPYFVPTSAVTIDWAQGSEIRAEHTGAPKLGLPVQRDYASGDKATEFFRFSQLRVTSKDGFQLEVDVRMVIRIQPENAAFVIARFGSVANLIEQIVHPLIDSSFRNKAGEKKAIEFVQTRTALQVEALERAREEFSQYHVEAQNLLIAYIAIDESLLETQTRKEIAFQQEEQYQQEARAEQERIEVENRRAKAGKQAEVVAAKLSIDIATDRAEAVRKEAEGVRDATRTKAEGEASAIQQVGEAHAQAYQAQTDVLGAERVALLKVLEQIATGKIKITPDTFVTNGDGHGGNLLLNAWLATMLGPNGPGSSQGTKNPDAPQETPKAPEAEHPVAAAH